MTYSVHQPWDPLRVCVVGRSYPPEFYSFIGNPRLRSLFEKIATETEEDFQHIIATLKKFNVDVVRPDVPAVQSDQYLTSNRRIPGPVSMNPRDQMIMIGDQFFAYPYNNISVKASGRTIKHSNWSPKTYHAIKGPDWPPLFTPYHLLPQWIQDECKHTLGIVPDDGDYPEEIASKSSEFAWWRPVTDKVAGAGNKIIYNSSDSILNQIPSNGITRIGKDLYFGVNKHNIIQYAEIEKLSREFFADYRCHFVTTGGHIDGVFTPVKPGLIVSTHDISTYADTFPGWEVVYLAGESWDKVRPFLDLKKKNFGRWWIKGSEYDQELIEYVETWLYDWVGYVEESVFDVNILVIDPKNIIVNGYNKTAFDAFDRHGITAHICPLRHRYFWDGGVHCVTLDLDREGSITDYFPERS
jgi:hypothetical protein